MNAVTQETRSSSEIQDEIVEDFALFDTAEEKYEYILDLGKKLPPLPAEFMTEEYIVRGCQAQVWLKADLNDGKIVLRAQSDAILVRGLISLLLRVYSGRAPSEILEAQPTFVDRIGMSQFLTSGRSNGLHSMINQIKYYAVAFEAKNEQDK